MAKFLLGVDDLRLITFDARIKFLQRIAAVESEATLSAMIMDREFLLIHGIGWNSRFYAFYPDHLEIRDVDLTNPGDSALARSRIVSFVQDRNLQTLRESTASHLIDIFPDLVLPVSLASYLGEVPFECVRIFVIFLANMMQRTYLCSAALTCPFCTGTISSPLFFHVRGFTVILSVIGLASSPIFKLNSTKMPWTACF
jgi:hypothetical protein